MTAEFKRRDVRKERALQYGDHDVLPHTEENEFFYFASARRKLTEDYAADQRNIWAENATILSPEFAAKDPVVVEFACGNGSQLRRLHRQYGLKNPAYGFDISPHSVNLARFLTEDDPECRNAPINYEVVDLEANLNGNSVPLEDGTADIVIMDFLTYHLQHPYYVIAEAVRVLKKDGLLQISSRDKEYHERTWKLAQLAADKIGAELPDTFYSHFDLDATYMALEQFDRTMKFQAQNFQDTALEIPLDDKRPGDRGGWVMERLSLIGLYHLMTDKIIQETLGLEVAADFSHFKRVLDTDIWSVFYKESQQRLAKEGKAYFKDRIRQGTFFYRKL